MTGRCGSARVDKLQTAQRLLHQVHPVLGRLASFLSVRVEPTLSVELETGIGALTVAADYLAKASVEALAYALAHASLHAVLGHLAPPPGRPEAWSSACDAQVERILRAFGLAPPLGPVRERHVWWGAATRRRGRGRRYVKPGQAVRMQRLPLNASGPRSAGVSGHSRRWARRKGQAMHARPCFGS